jgi:hypothetical protein
MFVDVGQPVLDRTAIGLADIGPGVHGASPSTGIRAFNDRDRRTATDFAASSMK